MSSRTRWRPLQLRDPAVASTFSVIRLERTTANGVLFTFRTEAAAQRGPLVGRPVADLREHEESDGKDDAEKGRVFDEGGAPVISMERRTYG